MSEIRRDGGRETWYRLRDWDKGQADSERFAAGLLHCEGYKDIDPSHPLGGRDGGKDIRCKRDGRFQIAGVYFPRGNKSISQIKKKFVSDLENAKKNGTEEFIFITNQELSLGERDNLTELAGNLPVSIYYLERISSILNTPAGYPLRVEYLQLAMNIEEETAFVKGLNRLYDVELPSLDLNFADADSRKILGKSVSVHSQVLVYDENQIPDCGAPTMPFGIRIPAIAGSVNRDYYREHIAFEFSRKLLNGLCLSIKNTGTVKLENVTIKMKFTLSEGQRIVGEHDYPIEPIKTENLPFHTVRFIGDSSRSRIRSVDVEERKGTITATCEVYDVKPKEEVFSDGEIYFGGETAGNIELNATVFADNLPEPVTFQLTVEVVSEREDLDVAAYIADLDSRNRED